MAKSFTSKNGIEVFVHPTSHIHNEAILEETIANIELPTDSGFIRTTIDLGHVIGYDHQVKRREDAKVVMIQRGNRAGLTPIVINQLPEETSLVTFVACVDTDPDEFQGKWCVITCFEGEQGMPEPWDRKCENNPELKAKCQKHWEENALTGTETEIRQVAEKLYDEVQFLKKILRENGIGC